MAPIDIICIDTDDATKASNQPILQRSVKPFLVPWFVAIPTNAMVDGNGAANFLGKGQFL